VADERKKPTFDRSLALTERLHRLIPGGAHTCANGDDQYPADTPPILVRGEGARVWDAVATIERVAEALAIYKRALEDGVERHLPGRSVQPVMRRLN
jgi:glutamate-1-semialdehyde aminotransferase